MRLRSAIKMRVALCGRRTGGGMQTHCRTILTFKEIIFAQGSCTKSKAILESMCISLAHGVMSNKMKRRKDG